MSEQFLKDPNAVIDYAVDWTANYLLVGEQVTTSNWEIVPSGAMSDLVIDNVPLLLSGVASVFISGGITGKVYRLINRISTDQGRTDDRTITIRVEEK